MDAPALLNGTQAEESCDPKTLPGLSNQEALAFQARKQPKRTRVLVIRGVAGPKHSLLHGRCGVGRQVGHAKPHRKAGKPCRHGAGGCMRSADCPGSAADKAGIERNCDAATHVVEQGVEAQQHNSSPPPPSATSPTAALQPHQLTSVLLVHDVLGCLAARRLLRRAPAGGTRPVLLPA